MNRDGLISPKADGGATGRCAKQQAFAIRRKIDIASFPVDFLITHLCARLFSFMRGVRMTLESPLARRDVILGRLAQGKSVAAVALALEFEVSEDAIRRDLRALAARVDVGVSTAARCRCR